MKYIILIKSLQYLTITSEIYDVILQKILIIATITFDLFCLKIRIAKSIVLLSPSTNEILNELNRLIDKKTSEPNKLAPYFLKIASTVIATYLAFIIEFMFNFGIFSDLLKIA